MDTNKWPVGGARLETIGNIVYGDLLFHLRANRLIHSFRFTVCPALYIHDA